MNIEQEAFERLKVCIGERPILVLNNSIYEIELHTDASKFLGGIIMQKGDRDAEM